MSVDKNQALVNFLVTCTAINGSTLYFNFMHAKNNSTGFVTLTNDRNIEEEYIDGSILKTYSMSVMSFVTMTDTPIKKVSGYNHQNISSMAEIQTLLDWVETQNDAKVYPDFGDDCVIQSMRTTSSNPTLNMIDATTNPPLAKYSFTIEIQYIDNTDKIWN